MVPHPGIPLMPKIFSVLLLWLETMVFVLYVMPVGDSLTCCCHCGQSAGPIHTTLLDNDLHLIYMVPDFCYACRAEESGIVGID